MSSKQRIQYGFTLVEVSFALLIVAILLGYTVALFPRQQELKQYRAVDAEMDRIIEAIVGFAQVNGRLPCPSNPASGGNESPGGDNECDNFGGFVPVNTLGLAGTLNQDTLLMDPWGNPYRYYVSASDFLANGVSDFVRAGEMRSVGLGDTNADTYTDLDGQLVICDQTDATLNDLCDFPAVPVFGNAAGAGGPYAGAPFVLISHGKNWRDGAPAGDELANAGITLSNAITTPMPNGVTGPYLIKDVEAGETTFVRRTTGFADNYDDVVKWVAPGILYSKMIDAGQLP